jgi:hypothetical protein
LPLAGPHGVADARQRLAASDLAARLPAQRASHRTSGSARRPAQHRAARTQRTHGLGAARRHPGQPAAARAGQGRLRGLAHLQRAIHRLPARIEKKSGPSTAFSRARVKRRFRIRT